MKQVTGYKTSSGFFYDTEKEAIYAECSQKLYSLLTVSRTYQMSGNNQQTSSYSMPSIETSKMFEHADEVIKILQEYKAAK